MTSSTFPSDGELLDLLLGQLTKAVCFKDAEQRFVRINSTLASWYGLASPADAVGKSDADFFQKDLAKTLGDAERAVLQTGRPKNVEEEKRLWPDGRVLWTSMTLLPLRDGNGTLGIYRDLGPEIQARQEVRRAEALYRGLVDGLPQSFFRKDLEGRVTFANRRYCEVLNKPLKDLLGKTDFDLFPENLARKYREDDARVIQTGIALDVIEAHKPPGKDIIYVRVVKTPVLDSDLRAVGVQGIFWQVPSGEAKKGAKKKKSAPAKPAKKKPKKKK